jgi:hypothetical protein
LVAVTSLCLWRRIWQICSVSELETLYCRNAPRETILVCELTRVQGVIPLRPCSSVGCSDIFVFVAKNLADLLGL